MPSRTVRRPRSAALVAAGLAALVVSGCGSSSSTASPTTTPKPASERPVTSPPGGAATTTTAPPAGTGATTTVAWGGYHANQARTGAVGALAAGSPATAWSADFGAAVYGQAVAADGLVYVATESDRVVALDPSDGHVVWSATLGRPLTDVAAVVGCGDIDPLGVTATPVVDAATGLIYVVAEVATGPTTVHRQLIGLDLRTGRIAVSDDVDPPVPAGEKQVTLLQRPGLALADGRVDVGFGGNNGDCGHYHGWVVGADATGPAHLVSFEVASSGEGGAVWEGGGAPAVDPAGHLFVSTGNANPDPPAGGPDPGRDTESVVELSADLRPLASFKDEAAGGDDDLSTGNPVLLPGGLVFSVGKTDVGYVLRQRGLSEVAAIHGVCGSNPDGGPAYDRALDRLYVPCAGGGIQEIDLATDRLGPLLPGSDGAPILTGGDLWALQYPEGTLTEYDAASGAVLHRVDVGVELPHFVSPSAAYGLVLVPTTTGVTAYRT